MMLAIISVIPYIWNNRYRKSEQSTYNGHMMKDATTIHCHLFYQQWDKSQHAARPTPEAMHKQCAQPQLTNSLLFDSQVITGDAANHQLERYLSPDSCWLAEAPATRFECQTIPNRGVAFDRILIYANEPHQICIRRHSGNFEHFNLHQAPVHYGYVWRQRTEQDGHIFWLYEQVSVYLSLSQSPLKPAQSLFENQLN